MGAAVSITRLDLTASELRKAPSGEKDSAAARRILALALVLDGVDRKTPAETCGMDRQTLRDWVHRYNAAGLAGASQSQIARSGIKTHGAAASRVGRACRGRSRPSGAWCRAWRRVDLRDELQRRFSVALHERSAGKVLAKLGYRKLSVRPRHPKADEEAQEAFDSRGANPRPRQRQADRSLVPRRRRRRFRDADGRTEHRRGEQPSDQDHSVEEQQPRRGQIRAERDRQSRVWLRPCADRFRCVRESLRRRRFSVRTSR